MSDIAFGFEIGRNIDDQLRTNRVFVRGEFLNVTEAISGKYAVLCSL